MKRRVPSRAMFLALVLALPAIACDEVAGASVQAKPIESQHDGFWWNHLGEQSLAIANFGPSFELPDGLYRQWSLVIHLPGTPEPLTCLQGLVSFQADHPIGARGEFFQLELRPRENHRWGDVRSADQILATVEGLY